MKDFVLWRKKEIKKKGKKGGGGRGEKGGGKITWKDGKQQDEEVLVQEHLLFLIDSQEFLLLQG